MKRIFASVLACVLAACPLSGCRGKPAGNAAKTPPDFSFIQSGRATLCTDTPCSLIEVPKDEAATLAKTALWLRKAAAYNGAVPKSPGNLVFNANVNPAVLVVTLPDKSSCSFMPCWYFPSSSCTALRKQFLDGVVEVWKTTGQNTGPVSYITCKPLYDWLKNDRWKTEFKNA